MLLGEKGQQAPGVKPRTPLALAASALPLSHDSWTTTNPHNPAQLSGSECFSCTPGSHPVCMEWHSSRILGDQVNSIQSCICFSRQIDMLTLTVVAHAVEQLLYLKFGSYGFDWLSPKTTASDLQHKVVGGWARAASVVNTCIQVQVYQNHKNLLRFFSVILFYLQVHCLFNITNAWAERED